MHTHALTHPIRWPSAEIAVMGAEGAVKVNVVMVMMVVVDADAKVMMMM